MSQENTVYEYLCQNYEKNEPVFLSEIRIPGMNSNSLRQQMKKLTENNKLRRFDTGIYYLPEDSIFRFGSMLSIDEIIKKRYLVEGNDLCGYMSGLLFANQLGLTSQVAMVYEIYTNKATTDYRETRIGNTRVIIRRPCVKINNENVRVLQFLDLLKEVTDISELSKSELNERLVSYMKRNDLDFRILEKYISYYPDRIYRNMYEAGLLYGIAT